ncbi:hypothetical protein [Hydrogenophaga sp. BPS33]|uniref:hypothetical protein n=1 Tax=Hydrogenophaga sp. BPS33 TaxID=2651974 RepID=UPI00135BAC0A|nr:hypothetical protein [Hydrogenophaga sp. BPS33]
MCAAWLNEVLAPAAPPRRTTDHRPHHLREPLAHRLGQVQAGDLLAQHRHQRGAGCCAHGTAYPTTEQANGGVHRHAVFAAFVPLARFGLVALAAQLHGLGVSASSDS